MISIIYRKAFSEVFEILKIMPKELVKKIPANFINMIETERDKNYCPNIREPLEECILLDETQILLGLIYGNFIEEK